MAEAPDRNPDGGQLDHLKPCRGIHLHPSDTAFTPLPCADLTQRKHSRRFKSLGCFVHPKQHARLIGPGFCRPAYPGAGYNVRPVDTVPWSRVTGRTERPVKAHFWLAFTPIPASAMLASTSIAGVLPESASSRSFSAEAADKAPV